jgi:hypothetical protein
MSNERELQFAAREGNVEKCAELIDKGTNVDAADKVCFPLSHYN